MVAEVVGRIGDYWRSDVGSRCIVGSHHAEVVEGVEVGVYAYLHCAFVEAACEVGSDGVVVVFLLIHVVGRSIDFRRVFATPSAVVLHPQGEGVVFVVEDAISGIAQDIDL